MLYFRFFRRVSQLTPHKLVDTLSASNIRAAFNLLTRPLAGLQKSQTTQDKVMEEVKVEITNLEDEITKLNNNTSRNQRTTTQQKTGRIDTVCSAACCSTGDTYNVKERRYNVCHKGCTCVKTKARGAHFMKIKSISARNLPTSQAAAVLLYWQNNS